MAGSETWLRRLLRSKEETALGPAIPHGRTRPSGPDTFAEDSNDFALAMYGQLRQRPGNLFFSPFSIRTALGMTYSGARGETAAQMREALRFPPSDETLHIAFAKIIQRLNAAGDGEYELAVANSLWGQEGGELQAGFLELIARYYGGAMNVVDFSLPADSVQVAINRWIEDKTKQKIRQLIPPGGLGAEARLVLVNALYFKGMWQLQFRKSATSDEPFYLEGGGTVRTALMYQRKEILYLQAKGYQAVHLNYRGDDFSMLVLLPDRKDGLRDLEKRLSAQMLKDCSARLGVGEVELYLPRFKITWGTGSICDQLNTLGVTLAFDRSQADFSGINGRQPPHKEALFISAVYHKAFAEVNEEGTEAVAVSPFLLRKLGTALQPRHPRQCPSSGLTIPSCSPSAIGLAV